MSFTIASPADALIGVPFETAVRIIGVSSARLRSWAKQQIVRPGIYRAGSWEFSLDDLVRARVVKELETRGVHIPKIDALVKTYEEMGILDPLLTLRWAVEGVEIFTQHPDGGWTGGRAPNQGVFIEIINPDAIRTETKRDLKRPETKSGGVEQRRGVLGGKPIFSGTRIPLEAVLSYLRHDMTNQQILAAYPDLTERDIATAREHLNAAA